MRNQRWVAAVAATALITLVAAGCGDDDAAPETTSSSPPPSASSAAISSSTTSSSTTSTVVETTTTVDQVALTKEAVAAAAVQSRLDYLYAVQNYDASDALAVLGRSTATNSPSFQLTVDNMENLRANGWLVRPNASVASVLTVEGDVTLLDGPPATQAELVACVVSAGIIYEPGAGPNGEDTIVNDEVVARRTRVTMIVEDGAWKLYTGEELASWSGQATCPPA